MLTPELPVVVEWPWDASTVEEDVHGALPQSGHDVCYHSRHDRLVSFESVEKMLPPVLQHAGPLMPSCLQEIGSIPPFNPSLPIAR